MTVPHSDCHCDKCMIQYYQQGLIQEGTPAYEDVMKLLKSVIGCCPQCAKAVYGNELSVKSNSQPHKLTFHEDCWKKIMRDPDRRPFDKESKFS